MDATIFSTQKAAGAGVIVQDHEGKFVAGLSKKIHAPLGTVEAKAKAFEGGIIFAKEVGIKEFVLEWDSLIIVQALKECPYAPSTVSHLIYGIQLNAKSLGMWLSYVKHQGNKPAHLLAKQGLADFSYVNLLSLCLKAPSPGPLILIFSLSKSYYFYSISPR